jgi:hypothetical protein
VGEYKNGERARLMQSVKERRKKKERESFSYIFLLENFYEIID